MSSSELLDDMFSSEDDPFTTDMFCGSIAVLEESRDKEILDKDKAVAQQLLDLLPDDANIGLLQHLRAYVSGVVLPSDQKKNKKKRKKINARKLRAHGLKNMFVVY